MSRVYIVDDDNAVRNALKLLFRTAQLDVEAFSSADAFLEDADLTQRCCVLLDIRMPGMTGTALHEELRRRSYRVPVIFITGHGDIPMAVDAMRKGAFDFIEKPFDDEQPLPGARRARNSTPPRPIRPSPAGPRRARARRAEKAEAGGVALELLLRAKGGPAARARRQAQPLDRRELAISVKTVGVPPRAHHAKLGVEDCGQSSGAALGAALAPAAADVPTLRACLTASSAASTASRTSPG
jgi:CheY-like chemotaxis protein